MKRISINLEAEDVKRVQAIQKQLRARGKKATTGAAVSEALRAVVG